MQVTLTPELERFVASELEEGHYESAAELVAHALAVLQEQRATLDAFEAADEARLSDLREQLAVADAEEARGEMLAYDSLDDLRADIRASRRER